MWFHLLPIDDMGSAEDLYIKMNSRGKPLTDFETFKAQLLKPCCSTETFKCQVVTCWTQTRASL